MKTRFITLTILAFDSWKATEPLTPKWLADNKYLLFWTEGLGVEVGTGTVESEDFRAGLGIVAFWETDVGSGGGAWADSGGGAWPKEGAKTEHSKNHKTHCKKVLSPGSVSKHLLVKKCCPS